MFKRKSNPLGILSHNRELESISYQQLIDIGDNNIEESKKTWLNKIFSYIRKALIFIGKLVWHEKLLQFITWFSIETMNFFLEILFPSPFDIF